MRPDQGFAGLQAGRMLGSRYRIVTSVGRGGMGEVYRADDLVLGAPVALKLLPASRSADPAWLVRFRSEVRLARSVSHPNVCRVFDIAEFEGRAFITMELIDGEDLASLLRRIGRLPPEKAVEMARQLCLGLAAIHEQGVVHRDLKPGNVMIDGRGRVRIADFGIAFATSGAPMTGDGAGTPLYMAPEQLARGETSTASDLYSLGLVLYEIFSGRPALALKPGASLEDLRDLHDSGTGPASLTTLVPDLDPAVDRAVKRCLEAEPARRPPSAVAVAMALPGGDPLAAALAAGETPSPALVAATGEKGVLSFRAATLLALAAVLGLAMMFVREAVLDAMYPASNMSANKPPEVLLERAREIIEQLHPGPAPADHWWSYTYAWQGVPRMSFSYRQAPWSIVNLPYNVVTSWSPHPMPGEVSLGMSGTGMLRWVQAVAGDPEDSPASASNRATTPEQAARLTEQALLFAGIDRAVLVPCELGPPQAQVEMDARATYSLVPGASLPNNLGRVDLAFGRGRLTSFMLLDPLPPVSGPEAPPPPKSSPLYRQVAELADDAPLYLAVLAAVGVVIWNHWRGRIDLRGTVRMGLFGWIITGVGVVLQAHYPDSLAKSAQAFAYGLMYSMGQGAISFALFYAALEPIVRRSWPSLLTSFSRLVQGRWRDPLVGRDVLVGLASLVPMNLLVYLQLDLQQGFNRGNGVGAWSGAAALAIGVYFGVLIPLALGFLLALFQLVVKRRWLATVTMFLLITLALAVAPPPTLLSGIVFCVVYASGIALLARFGLVVVAAMIAFTNVAFWVRFDVHFGAWYGGAGVPVVLAWLALIALAWWTSQGAERAPSVRLPR